jgi:Uma2 family endonuclease
MATSWITWEDVQQAPEDGKRREAIGGDLYVTAAPSVRHQRVSGRLERTLRECLEDPGHGEVLDAPVGVEFPETGEGVQPDLLFVSNDRRGIVAEDWLRGAPDLVVEIVSPTTAERDRGLKRDLYRRQGVREYWIVDPEEDAVEVWRFGEGARDGGSGGPDAPARTPGTSERSSPTHERFTERLPVRAGGEVVGEIDLEEVFRRGA